MKRGDRNVVRLCGVDHALDLLLCVGRVGERHRGLGETERPARRQRGAAGERDEFLGDVLKARPEDQIEVEVAVLGLVSAVAAEIIVVFAAEVERALGAVVVEEAMRDAARPVSHDQERPVLVEGIAALGIEAERIAHGASESPPGEVERAGLVAKAIMTIAGRARHRVPEGMGPLPEKVRLRLAVAGEDGSIGKRPVHAKAIERNRQAQRRGRQHDMRRRRHDFRCDRRPRRVVQPVAAGPLRVRLAVRGDSPCALLPDLASAQNCDPDEIVGQRDDPHLGAVAAVEHKPARVG